MEVEFFKIMTQIAKLHPNLNKPGNRATIITNSQIIHV